MSSTGFTGGSEINKSPQSEKSNRRLILRLVIWFKSTGSYEDESNREAKSATHNENNICNLVDKNTGETFSSCQFDISSEKSNAEDVDIRDEWIVLNENTIKHIKSDCKKVSEYIRKYCNLYSDVTVYLITPSDNDLSVYPHLFLLQLLDNPVFNEPRINKQKSKCIPAYLKGNTQYNDENVIASSPNDYDVKMAALFSHYVYYYLDWLEYSHYYSSKNIRWNLFEEKNKDGDIETKVKIIDENNNPINTSFFSGNGKGAEKIQFRIVNRLKEIADICKSSTRITKEIIDEILISSKNKPEEFYELYDKFGYWDYVKIGGLKECAKMWHVLHPGIIYERIYKKKWHFFDSNKKIYIVGDKVGEEGRSYYNTVLKHGMGKVDGYGGLLFVQTDPNNNPIKFAYATKGTDVNSFNDWILVDILQGLTGFSLQHLHTVNNAKTIDKAVRSQHKNIPLFFCGHSLGGGLASSNAIASIGRHAITFNAAGLNFIGSLTTRGFSIISGNLAALNPSNTTKRVHPIRIEGEAIDEIMKVARLLSGGMNERGYGRNPLVLQFQDNFLKDSAAKHGINNFLNESILRQLRLVNKPTNLRAVNGVVKKITLKDVSNNSIEFLCGEGLGLVVAKNLLKEKLGKYMDKLL